MDGTSIKEAMSEFLTQNGWGAPRVSLEALCPKRGGGWLSGQ